MNNRNKTPSRRIVFLAPGSGLGHLVRASALSLDLEKTGIPCTILSTSLFAVGMRRLTGLDVIAIPPSKWAGLVPACLKKINPGAVVQDTFPFGFRGEDLTEIADRVPFIYLARRLKVSEYLSIHGKKWNPESSLVANTIILETLSDDHMDLLEKTKGEPILLDGWIKFDHEAITRPPLPFHLSQKASSPYFHLVVHSGPADEINQLVALAETSVKNMGKGCLAIISPLYKPNDRNEVFDYFPASTLYERAFKVYTGAGYNACAEASDAVEKHVFIPFQRIYDDQNVRLENMESNRANGKSQAVRYIKKVSDFGLDNANNYSYYTG